ncbi:tectonic-3 isoform X2 [Protopterus annectens]|uniref:tectonic-3 isoform X2 n=1 Tax=Protopterus annectens TaxID=7888 RepID=UPI001CFAD88C|nr:tectonic-3 isoform X2 [Protopterus annectens]
MKELLWYQVCICAIATVLLVPGFASNGINCLDFVRGASDGKDATVARHTTYVSYSGEIEPRTPVANPVKTEIVTSDNLYSTIKENPFAATESVVRAIDRSAITIPVISEKDATDPEKATTIPVISEKDATDPEKEFKVTSDAEITVPAQGSSSVVVPAVMRTRQHHQVDGVLMTSTISALVISTDTENGTVEEEKEVAEGSTVAVATHEDRAVEENATISTFRQSVSTETILPYCTCDLTAMCDIGCCCDRNCNLTNPEAVFVSCLPGSRRVVSQVCVDDFLIFRTNAPYPTTVVKEPGQNRQYCIEVDNPSLNYFVEPQSVNSTNFEPLLSQYGRPSFIKASQSLQLSSSFYRVGDPILTYFPSTSALGALGLPGKMGSSGVCVDASPAGFLQRRNITCSRIFTNLNNQCDLPFLSASTYYSGFVVLKTPNYSNANLSEMKVNIINGNRILSPSLIENSCSNVVSKSNPHVPSISVRSGNPGYIIGAPLLALTVKGELVPVTVLQNTANGLCTEELRTTVPFGYNMRSSCTHSFSENTANNCAQLRNESYSFLQGKSILKSLAALGNATASQTAFWAGLVYGSCAVQNEDGSESCTIPIGLDIQIVWAYVGKLSNPQAQVLGGRFLFKCKTITCCNVSTSMVTTVTFYDTTIRPVAPRGEPQINWRFPFDFFFPFKAAISGVKSHPASELYIVVLCLFTLNLTRMWHR